MPDYSWLEAYLAVKPGVTRDYKEEWGWHRFKVGGKMFAALTHLGDKYDSAYAGKDLINLINLINLKCDYLLASQWREEHLEVMPG